MKKNRCYLILAFLVFSFVVPAQVSAYVFTQLTSTYIPLPSPGSTVVAAGFQDDNVYGNIPIGFNFNYNNTTYTSVGLSTNGWMSFGGNVPNDNFAPISNSSTNGVAFMSGDMQLGPYQTCTITSGSNLVAFTNTLAASLFNPGDVLTGTGIPGSTSVVAIGVGNMTISANATAAGTAITAGGKIAYVVTGIAPNRIFTLEFKQLGRWNNDGTGQDDYVNAQIKLYETSNDVEIVYGNAGTFNNNTMQAEIGLAGSSSLDFNNREVPISISWAASTQGFNNSAKAILSNSNTIPNGLIYRWIPPSPCTGVPSSNNAIASSSFACLNGNVFLNLAQTYTTSGLNYQWSAATNSVGPFSVVGTFTSAPYTATNVSANTWFLCEITCTNSAQTFTTLPIQITSVSTITASIPYYEGFESVPLNNELPNCSWTASNQGIICQTYTNFNTNNRIPKSGNKFAAFSHGTNPNGDYFYSNKMWLYAGYTYSASTHYVSDGDLGWSEFSILVGPNQSTLGLMSVASVTGSIINTTHQLLSNTFSVATSGYYHVAVKAIGSNNPWYLSWDDLSVTAPCALNTPTISISTSSNTICEGSAISFTASGAYSYTWNTTPVSYSHLAASLAALNTTYTSQGINLVNCIGVGAANVLVQPKPLVIVAPVTQSICLNSTATIVASGAVSYTWNPSNVKSATFTLSPQSNNSYSVLGTGSNGCIGSNVSLVTVDPCTGISEFELNSSSLKVYPIPTSNFLYLETELASSLNWKLTDLTGRVVLLGESMGKTAIIEISKIETGIYYLMIETSNNKIVKKIIKE